MGVITQPWSDRITGRSACGIVEIASRTSQVSGLISFPNSPSLPTLGSCVIGDKAYEGLSTFVRVQCRESREYGEVKLFGSRKCVVASQRYAFAAQQHCTVHCSPAALQVRISLLTGQLSGLYAGDIRAGVFAITFRIHEDQNKIHMSKKTVMLRTLYGFLSSQHLVGTIHNNSS